MKSRSKFFAELNAEVANPRWAWCAVNHGSREVYFGVWDTQSTKVSGTILSETWSHLRGRRQPGFDDALRKIKLVTAENYSLHVFKMFQGQNEFEESPSKIAAIEEELRPASVKKIGDRWIAFFSGDAESLSEEFPEAGVNQLPEGAKKSVVVNAYERSAKARALCIDHFDARCQACELDFEEKYGELGRGFIHVHHIRPISTINSEYMVDPKTDLVPLCPNCHAMVHRVNPPIDVADLRALLKSQGANQ